MSFFSFYTKSYLIFPLFHLGVMFENDSHLIISDKNINEENKLTLYVEPMPYTEPLQETGFLSGF